jgi:KTSC domain
MATRRRVRVKDRSPYGGSAAPSQPRQVERGMRNRPAATHDINAEIAANRQRSFDTGNRRGTASAPGNWTDQGTLPNSETIPNSRYYGNRITENTEADRFSKEDNETGYWIPLTYAPTKTAFPGNGWDHRRTIAAGYDLSRGMLAVQFYTDGSVYHYGIDKPVPQDVAKRFRLAASPGRFINNELDSYGFVKVS